MSEKRVIERTPTTSLPWTILSISTFIRTIKKILQARNFEADLNGTAILKQTTNKLLYNEAFKSNQFVLRQETEQPTLPAQHIVDGAALASKQLVTHHNETLIQMETDYKPTHLKRSSSNNQHRTATTSSTTTAAITANTASWTEKNFFKQQEEAMTATKFCFAS